MNENYVNLISKDMNKYLSNLNVLYVKLHNYHWNVVGKGFFTLHEKLEEIYNGVNAEIDVIAERILMIGGKPLGSLREYLSNSTLKESSNDDIQSSELVKSLLSDFELLLDESKSIYLLADSSADPVTSSIIENSISNYEKNIWMLKSYLK